jgi:hypothetical protein
MDAFALGSGFVVVPQGRAGQGRQAHGWRAYVCRATADLRVSNVVVMDTRGAFLSIPQRSDEKSAWSAMWMMVKLYIPPPARVRINVSSMYDCCQFRFVPGRTDPRPFSAGATYAQWSRCILRSAQRSRDFSQLGCVIWRRRHDEKARELSVTTGWRFSELRHGKKAICHSCSWRSWRFSLKNHRWVQAA